MKIKVLLGGLSSEREVSLDSGNSIAKAIRTQHDVQKVFLNEGWDRDNLPDKLKSADLVFIALHGGSGENGEIQKLLDFHKIRYTGSGAKASKLAMSKYETKQLAVNNGITTPDWRLIQINEKNNIDFAQIDLQNIEYPCVVKPNDEGSTMGLSIVKNEKDIAAAVKFAASFSTDILIEQFIEGREITVGILGDQALPIVEIIPKHGLYDYECKYTHGMSEYLCPAEIDQSLTSKIQNAAQKIFHLSGCRHYGRVDFRLTQDNNFHLLEANTLPGMTDTSLLPKAAAADNINYNELVLEIIRIALEK